VGEKRVLRYVTFFTRASIFVALAYLGAVLLIDPRFHSAGARMNERTNIVERFKTNIVEVSITNTTLVQSTLNLTNTILVVKTNLMFVTNLVVLKTTNYVPVSIMVTQIVVVPSAQSANKSASQPSPAKQKKTRVKGDDFAGNVRAVAGSRKNVEARGGIAVNVNNEPSIEISVDSQSPTVVLPGPQQAQPSQPTGAGQVPSTMQSPTAPVPVAPPAIQNPPPLPPSPQSAPTSSAGPSQSGIIAPQRFPLDLTSQIHPTHNGKSALLKVRLLISLPEPPSPETIKLLDTSSGNYLTDMAREKAAELIALNPAKDSEQRALERLTLDYLAGAWKYLAQEKISLEGAYISF
jgi:hypothetical protein